MNTSVTTNLCFCSSNHIWVSHNLNGHKWLHPDDLIWILVYGAKDICEDLGHYSENVGSVHADICYSVYFFLWPYYEGVTITGHSSWGSQSKGMWMHRKLILTRDDDSKWPSGFKSRISKKLERSIKLEKGKISIAVCTGRWGWSPLDRLMVPFSSQKWLCPSDQVVTIWFSWDCVTLVDHLVRHNLTYWLIDQPIYVCHMIR